MLPDVFFPSTVMLLKFAYKLLIANEPKPMEFFRAFCSFPVDLGFLSLSFFAAFIYSAPPENISMYSQKDTLGGFVLMLLITFLITYMCRLTDNFIVRTHYVWSGFITVATYGVSVSMVFTTIEIGASLK